MKLYHPMTEKPVRSCEILLLSKWFKLCPASYSEEHQCFGIEIKDSSKQEDVQMLKCEESCYIGWAYADQIVWKMVEEYEIHG